ncbi:heterokaryon incompatibility protein-domain-containing protein [Nemania sp. FL0031]|nr:heterokaryon incompatibility protein-domain-containing protein [Nemania sp. FL0031]
MNGFLYSVRSRSHIHFPHQHGVRPPRSPESNTCTTSPETIPLPAPYPGDELSLCVRCRNVELDGQDRDYFSVWSIYLGELLTIINTRDCSLCKTVTRAISQCLTPNVLRYAKDEANLIHVLATPHTDDTALKIWFENTTRDGALKGLAKEIHSELHPWGCSRLLRIDANSLSKSIMSSAISFDLYPARQLQRGRCDLESMRNHLQHCIKQHRGSCVRNGLMLRELNDERFTLRLWPEGFRVIDVEQLRVMPAPPGCSYLALSYVWDHSNKNHLSQAETGTFPDLCKPQGISISQLPQTIADAIFVCQQLGERYLWVDALCIIQDDPADKIVNITRMGEIFSLATATIVAACGHDPSKGLTCLRTRDPEQVICSVRGIQYIASEPRLDQTIKDTLWYSRGWTYQEYRLSKRLVVFTSAQAFFVCGKGTYPEDTTYPTALDEWPYMGYRLDSWDMPTRDLEGSTWTQYNSAVSDYTRRRLTVASDRLPAISGILQLYGRYSNDIFLCGLPAKLLHYSLLWHPSGESKRFGGWPSWSWVGWTSYVFNLVAEGVEYQLPISSTLKHLRFRGEDGDEVPISQPPEDEELMSRRKDYLARKKHKRSQHKRDTGHQSAVDGRLVSKTTGHLLFIGQTRRFSLAPDPDFHDPTEVGLYKYRIYAGKIWVGTIFLTAAQVALYPNRADDLEFLRLTNCTPYIYFLEKLLCGFGLWDSIDSGNWDYQPAIFDTVFYERARSWARMKFERGLDPRGDERWEIRLSHVMLFKRVGYSIIEREAVGLVVEDYKEWRLESFVLT